MHKIFDCKKETGQFYVPTKFLANKLCDIINSRRDNVCFDYDKCQPIFEAVRFVKDWNDIWDMPHTYSSVKVIPLRWGWLAIYR